MARHHKSSDEIEREIEARRARIEQRVDQITSRLSPGQLVDEALRFTREGPGADFTRNLGRSVVNNPLPVALMGMSLAWLAVQSNMPRREHYEDGYDADAMYGRYEVDEEDYPVATIQGRTLQRVGVIESDEGRHSEFTDDAGRKFKALTSDAGHRAGHFVDESGRMFRGFIDEAGHRVSDFRDEAGNRMHQASGWASHTWRKAGENASRLGERMRHGADRMGAQAQHAGDSLRRQGSHAAHMADDFIHEQPLVSGAIAFAIGALFGGALPHTRQEDEMFGEAADSVKDRAAHEAEHLYDRGREEAAHLHEQAREVAGRAYGDAKDAARGAADTAKAEADKITHH
ncbi:DUF3618 domain-containing protein [Pelagibacterium sp. H642]|uniref:DUF3618 domain-containing protein n=1 Tax=Pelagibacterium sp. H642 TaxID=1881069 RepID=UPI0028155BDA|nr:DUF3618 domain-containing protein [Pelagibacterium sp. H642]WMT91070.1 DUF3618 domain-containing protein [Pelagibacterium sp. H642]